MKVLLYVGIVSFLFLFGCNANDERETVNPFRERSTFVNEEGQAWRDSLMSMTNLSEVRLVWNALTPEIRLIIWRNKLEQARSKLTDSTKTAFMDTLISRMEPDWFDWETSRIDWVDSVVLELTVSAFNVFSKQDVFEIFFLIDDYNPSVPIQLGFDEVECDCSTESDWCSWFTTSSCDRSCANSSHRGCGTFWRYKCNGSCT
jgi:hypothetical protein